MIKRGKIREIVSNWVLKNPEYKRLEESRVNLQNFLYDLSWKGHEDLRPYIKLCETEDYIAIGQGYWWWAKHKDLVDYLAKSFSITECNRYNYKNLTLNDKINLDLTIVPPENTLSIDFKKLSRSNKLKLKNLVGEMVMHVRILRKGADYIFETLMHPNMTLARIMKYYPDLINERK